MKKLLFVFALVAAFGVAMAVSISNVTVAESNQIENVDHNEPDGDKAEAKTKAETKSKKKSDGCCSSKKAAEAKKDGCCSSKKTADAKKDCDKDCGEDCEGCETAQKSE